MKKSSSALRHFSVQVSKSLLISVLFLSSVVGTTLFSQPVYAQTQAEATECYRRNNGIPRNQLLSNGSCKVENGGNCAYFDTGVRCNIRPGTAPVEIEPGINDLDECVDQSDLSFDWGGDSCIDTTELISIVFGVLASLVGIAVVGGIVWGGMLYATSNGNSAKAQQGISTIVNAVIGLLIFIFLFAVTNFLVPGGIFRG